MDEDSEYVVEFIDETEEWPLDCDNCGNMTFVIYRSTAEICCAVCGTILNNVQYH